MSHLVLVCQRIEAVLQMSKTSLKGYIWIWPCCLHIQPL